MRITIFINTIAALVLSGAFLWALSAPALAECVTNDNDDTFCYEELPHMPHPPPKKDLGEIEPPPPPGFEWECTFDRDGKKTCFPIAIKGEEVNPTPVEPTPLQGTTIPVPFGKCGSGDPMKGLGIPSGGGSPKPKTPCPSSN